MSDELERELSDLPEEKRFSAADAKVISMVNIASMSNIVKRILLEMEQVLMATEPDPAGLKMFVLIHAAAGAVHEVAEGAAEIINQDGRADCKKIPMARTNVPRDENSESLKEALTELHEMLDIK